MMKGQLILWHSHCRPYSAITCGDTEHGVDVSVFEADARFGNDGLPGHLKNSLDSAAESGHGEAGKRVAWLHGLLLVWEA